MLIFSYENIAERRLKIKLEHGELLLLAACLRFIIQKQNLVKKDAYLMAAELVRNHLFKRIYAKAQTMHLYGQKKTSMQFKAVEVLLLHSELLSYSGEFGFNDIDLVNVYQVTGLFDQALKNENLDKCTEMLA